MSYLLRLKRLEDEHSSALPFDDEPSKPSKDSFEGFEGFEGEHMGYVGGENIQHDDSGNDELYSTLPTKQNNQNALLNVLIESVSKGGVAWMWEVSLPDRDLVVTTTPPSTVLEMLEMYPTAISLEALE